MVALAICDEPCDCSLVAAPISCANLKTSVTTLEILRRARLEIVAQLESLVDDDRALFHVVHGLAGFVLNAADQLADFLGGGGGFFRQLADFIGDHRKAQAVFAGAGGFNGGVERQQVGLLGDVVDDLDDFADVVDALAEAADDGGRGADGRR